MRIGFGRLAQKSCSRHSRLRHGPLLTNIQSFPSNRPYQYSHLSQTTRHAFTTTSKQLDEAESELRQQNEENESTPVRLRHRSKQKVSAEQHKASDEQSKEALAGVRNAALKAKRKDPNTWSLKLNDIYLLTGGRSPNQDASVSPFQNDDVHEQILQIMDGAWRFSNTELLTYMGITQGKWKAVLWTADVLLQNISTRKPCARCEECPSNIDWGSGGCSLQDLTRKPFSVESLAYANIKTIEDSITLAPDPKYSDWDEGLSSTMRQIWQSVGNLIIEAAELPEEHSEVIMAVVYQIIAKIHALDLVPDNVYSFASCAYSNMVSRPPILHLLSSRVLTTLSDATWRSHQMDVIEQAVSLGTPLKNLIKDLPGGRFRLKVRPLGPEVWLEFVLWCCVEGGFTTTGIRVIRQLREKTQNPWFAMPWTSQTGNVLSSTVDWNRVRSRHGGSVGLIEGYNREAPFVEMAPRTVSAEVVLMLVETIATSVNTPLTARMAPRRISSLIEFLEPHSLPSEYFDYVAVRLLQTGASDIVDDPTFLERWAEKVSDLRSLETTVEAIPAKATFDIPSIIKQSEVYAGMLHQAMDAHVNQFDVRSAIAVFNRIQEFVDVSKLQSISAFLATTFVPSEDVSSPREFFSPYLSTNRIGSAYWNNLDFVRSHGQLPLHKLASFLNLTTDSKLFRIGQWLLYSDEVDEPVVPERLYNKSSLMTALVRFAGAAGDQHLLRVIIRARRRTKLLPSVSLLRSLVDTFVSNYQFEEARETLSLLRTAKGGGYSPKNMASVAASIWRLDSQVTEPDEVAARTQHHKAWDLMREIITGEYDGRKDTFRIEINNAFRQQIAALLRIISSTDAAEMSSLAKKWQVSFPLNNLTILSTDTFNVMMASIVDTKGSLVGMNLWKSFCDDLVSERNNSERIALDDILLEDDILGNDDDWHWPRRPTSVPRQLATGGEYVPFVEPPTDVSDGMNAEGSQESSDQDDFLSEQTQFANAFPVEVDETPVLETEIGPKLLVKPDLRTLRIIVQGALAERRARERENRDTSSQIVVLKWAAQFYQQLGTSTKIIEQEIQLVIGEAEADSSIESRKRRREEQKMWIEVAAADCRANQAGHIYKQFHGWRPTVMKSGQMSKQLVGKQFR